MWIFPKFDPGRLGKIVEKKSDSGHVVGKPFDSFHTLYEKNTVREKNANMKMVLRTHWNTTLVADAAAEVDDFYSPKQI